MLQSHSLEANVDTKITPLLSVVVLNWNGKRFIDSFIDSYQQQTVSARDRELIFVDNGSTDDSVEYLKQKYGSDSSIKIVNNKKNYGYAQGNNLGMKQASGEYILIVNNDIEMHSDLLKEILNLAHKKNADAVVAKLMFLNKPGYINNAGSILDPDSTWPVKEIGINELDQGQYNSVREITAVCGACVLFKRTFLEKVGLFDSRFFMYFEDGDLSWRGQKAAAKFYYCPTAVAYHVHTGSSKEGSSLFNFYVGRNRVLILAKNARWIVFIRGLSITLYWHLIIRIVNIFRAILGKASKKRVLIEFWQSQKMLLSIFANLPYAFSKRWHLIGEERL